jgi:tRNA threonylcarbamoyl adenosine modification protein (Sua5/YciO/YrdC/YwlC family)
VSYRFDCAGACGRRRGLVRARAVLDAGEIVVVPTEASYGLACDAFSTSGVAALREAKGSRTLAPAVLIASGRTLDGLATDVPPAGRDLAEAFWPGPLTLMCHAQPSLDWRLGEAGGGLVSLRVPLHPVLLQLLTETGPLAVTSANIPGHRPPVSHEEAYAQLGELPAVYLDAGPTHYCGPSTVVDTRGAVPRIVRRGALTAVELRAVAPGLVDLEEAST